MFGGLYLPRQNLTSYQGTEVKREQRPDLRERRKSSLENGESIQEFNWHRGPGNHVQRLCSEKLLRHLF